MAPGGQDLVPESRFVPSAFLPGNVYSKVVDLRVSNPSAAPSALAARVKRRVMVPDGRLTLLAADHPARMVTGIRGDPLRMGRRHELLSRILRVMACSPFDGILGTADVLDELVLASSFVKSKGILNRRVLVGSVNRGGVSGSSFEMDDRATGYDVPGAVAARLDGLKFLLRFDPADADSLKTLAYCVETARDCAAAKMPLFIEPLPAVRSEGKVKTDNDKAKLIKLVGLASAIGSTSSNLWLKLPYCEGFEEVAGATTLPVVLLGGEASDDVLGLLRQIETAMKAGPNVRGVMMGRNLLYPPEEDPLPLAMAVNSIVHERKSAERAKEEMERWPGKNLDVFVSND
jgi:hypothetical protein